MQSGRTKYAVLLQSDAVNLVCITYDSYTHRGDIKMKHVLSGGSSPFPGVFLMILCH